MPGVGVELYATGDPASAFTHPTKCPELFRFQAGEFFKLGRGSCWLVPPLTTEITESLYVQVPGARKLIKRVRARPSMTFINSFCAARSTNRAQHPIPASDQLAGLAKRREHHEQVVTVTGECFVRPAGGGQAVGDPDQRTLDGSHPAVLG